MNTYRSNLSNLSADSLTIENQPDKTTYLVGESLDLTGLEVSAEIGSLNGDVTNDITTIPEEGHIITGSEQSVKIKYGGLQRSFNINIATIYDIVKNKTTPVTEEEWISFVNANGIKQAIDNNETSAFIGKSVEIYNSNHCMTNYHICYIIGFGHENSGYTVDLLDAPSNVSSMSEYYDRGTSSDPTRYSYGFYHYIDTYRSGFSLNIQNLLTNMTYTHYRYRPDISRSEEITVTNNLKDLHCKEFGIPAGRTANKYDSFNSLSRTYYYSNTDYYSTINDLFKTIFNPMLQNSNNQYNKTLLIVTDSNYILNTNTTDVITYSGSISSYALSVVFIMRFNNNYS